MDAVLFDLVSLTLNVASLIVGLYCLTNNRE